MGVQVGSFPTRRQGASVFPEDLQQHSPDRSTPYRKAGIWRNLRRTPWDGTFRHGRVREFRFDDQHRMRHSRDSARSELRKRMDRIKSAIAPRLGGHAEAILSRLFSIDLEIDRSGRDSPAVDRRHAQLTVNWLRSEIVQRDFDGHRDACLVHLRGTIHADGQGAGCVDRWVVSRDGRKGGRCEKQRASGQTDGHASLPEYRYR